MSSHGVATRYAKALFKLEQGNVEQAKAHLQGLRLVVQLFELSESAKILRSPVMPVALKRDLLRYGLDRGTADQILEFFIESIIDAGRVQLIPDIVEAFAQLIHEAEGVVVAQLTSAVELPGEDADAIGSGLGQILGKQVELITAVDKALLGGFVAKVGNYRIDMSLKTKLDGLAQSAVQ